MQVLSSTDSVAVDALAGLMGAFVALKAAVSTAEVEAGLINGKLNVEGLDFLDWQLRNMSMRLKSGTGRLIRKLELGSAP